MKEVNIEKSEVLRYLGYHNQRIDGSLDSLIDSLIEECKRILKPKYIYTIFEINIADDGISLSGSNLIFKGQAIKAHLEGAKSCVVMAATLGAMTDKKLLAYQNGDMSKAVIFDAVATAAVESLCDMAEEEIKRSFHNQHLNFRFSPGYGDFPLDIQPGIISALSAEKRIGLTVTSSNILIPRKSVTAVMGIFEQPFILNQTVQCNECNLKSSCGFRKKDGFCEHNR